MNDNTTIDRRIERTRTALREALLRLVRRETWDSINVRMICTEADVARSSFYLHFNNKLALLDFMFESGLEDAAEMVLGNDAVDGQYATFQWLVDHVVSGKEQFGLGQSANQVIFVRFQSSVVDLLERELRRLKISFSNEKCVFIVGGAFALLQDWAADGCKEDRAAILARLNEYARKILI